MLVLNTVRDLFCPNRMEVNTMRKYRSRSELPSMEEAYRLAIARMGNGEPNIGFVSADDKLDEVAVFNTAKSGEYK